MQSRTKAGQWLIAALGGLSLAAAALPACAGTSSIMQVSGRTSQPIGHYEYCQKNRADCSIVSFNDRPMELTRALWSDMERINTYANAVIRPATDYQIFGVEEVWTLPTNYGDCEDYVLLKRKMLMDMGWPASSLLVTVVRQPNGDGHAVLTVRTDRGDFILDNLSGRIVTWDKSEYAFVKRQSAMNSGKWEGIVDNRARSARLLAVGSVN
ncbi:MAG: transglutaminase-like cysteine peptidase [Nitratireductor sp.]|nr:transglutaminase-like cysteine peptidase [Nitratireductor sp.]